MMLSCVEKRKSEDVVGCTPSIIQFNNSQNRNRIKTRHPMLFSTEKQATILSGLYEDCIARAELAFFYDAFVLARILREWVLGNARTENIFKVHKSFNEKLVNVFKTEMRSGNLVGFEIDRDGTLISENTSLICFNFNDNAKSINTKTKNDLDQEMNHLAKKFKDELSTATEYDSSDTFKVPKFIPKTSPKTSQSNFQEI